MSIYCDKQKMQLASQYKLKPIFQKLKTKKGVLYNLKQFVAIAV